MTSSTQSKDTNTGSYLVTTKRLSLENLIPTCVENSNISSQAREYLYMYVFNCKGI